MDPLELQGVPLLSDLSQRQRNICDSFLSKWQFLVLKNKANGEVQKTVKKPFYDK